ncbi:TPA: hypothetical protein DEW49_01990 [bacterium]|nr:hypothetical protein [bacterium]
MHSELADVIITYATKPHKELSGLLLDKSKDQLISLLTTLLTIYINDRNSSTIREYITVSLAGYTHIDKKIGYNGFKQSTTIGGKSLYCEAKPQNINTENNKSIKHPRKLNGGGNFTDYTYNRLQKDISENPNMLVSGFVNGELIYILEFPFNYPTFTENLKKQLKKRFPKGDKTSEFLRSANFNYEDYRNCPSFKVIYLSKGKLERTKDNFNRKFYDFLEHIK